MYTYALYQMINYCLHAFQLKTSVSKYLDRDSNLLSVFCSSAFFLFYFIFSKMYPFIQKKKPFDLNSLNLATAAMKAWRLVTNAP